MVSESWHDGEVAAAARQVPTSARPGGDQTQHRTDHRALRRDERIWAYETGRVDR